MTSQLVGAFMSQSIVAIVSSRRELLPVSVAIGPQLAWLQ